ncbi:unnamed protein product, partial [Schistosoma turkestanicum]
MKCRRKTPKQIKRCEWLEKLLKLESYRSVFLPPKKNHLFLDFELLNRYQDALSKALELSMKHNLPPINGSTLIICSTSKYVNQSKRKSSKSYIKIMGFLLGSMCTWICETPTTYVTVNNEYNLTPIEVLFKAKHTTDNNNDIVSHVHDSKSNKYRCQYKKIGILEKTKQIYGRRK